MYIKIKAQHWLEMGSAQVHGTNTAKKSLTQHHLLTKYLRMRLSQCTTCITDLKCCQETFCQKYSEANTCTITRKVHHITVTPSLHQHCILQLKILRREL